MVKDPYQDMVLLEIIVLNRIANKDPHQDMVLLDIIDI